MCNFKYYRVSKIQLYFSKNHINYFCKVKIKKMIIITDKYIEKNLKLNYLKNFGCKLE